jgi:hypothetical protein
VFNLRPYMLRPISTLAAIASDPIESWVRFYEQYAAHREGQTPTNLYKPNVDWESRLHSLIDLTSSGELVSEFWALWATVVNEMQEQGIQAGPASFKGWNDGDAGFVSAIWCLVRRLKLELPTGSPRVLFLRLLREMEMAICGALIARRWSPSGNGKLELRLVKDFRIGGLTYSVPAGDVCRACWPSLGKLIYLFTTACTASATFALRSIVHGQFCDRVGPLSLTTSM